ncbi:heparanase [Elysia marginata]|uniref:Heparanase n=1 Tax=Elysia marginata TaxID=1093978 RepID=A0AAV4GCH2_9GAST|nr:heparanase [Elysia marginata]
MWDFNLFHFKRGRWDPKFARKFLKYSASRGVRIPSFQLGNEPNLYKTKFNMSLDGKRLAEDFMALKDLISELPMYSASGIYGPDVTNLDNHKSARNYLQHYYLTGSTAVLADFVDPRVLDSLKTQLEYAYDIAWENCRIRKPIRLTETSSATQGGVEGVTDAFVAGFLWLDKLGLSATYRVTHVFRQTFFASKYALISREMVPNPDYYLSVMFKRLVEGPVFKVITEGLSPLDCSWESSFFIFCVSYPDGAMVVYYLNMAKEQTLLSASQLLGSSGRNRGNQLDLFIFTPGDSNGLLSRKVSLNGKVLEMNGNHVPRMDAKIHSGDVPLTPESYGFVVMPYAEVPLCKHYHRSENF